MMFRILFAFVLLIHGMIHFLGFVKAFGFFPVDQLSQPISKPLGLIWLILGTLFLVGIFSLLTNKEWWMLLPVVAVLSQILISIYWQDAKYGTIINALILLVCIVAYGSWSFDRKVDNEISILMDPNGNSEKVITKESINHLPPIVQKWMDRSKTLDKPPIQLAYMRQTGRMRTTPDGRWMVFSARQFINAEKPGFVWQAHAKVLPLLHISARDKYINGRGNMLVKFLSLANLADVNGNEIDQGALSRFLAEMIWYPSAALNEAITWKAIDQHTAEAIIKYKDGSASGIFSFTPQGDAISFDALRYYVNNNQSSLEKWHIEIDENSYQDFEDRRIPTKASVTWKLNSGDFTWYKLEVEEAIYDVSYDD
ncbi:MAG: DUF6544 family protein [Reichenbachiella sp.]|uniref:DUF6544 family protein n=1 Tax=Reichenbachiella sp. TaxID=2184521 RepID=UPI003267DD0D